MTDDAGGRFHFVRQSRAYLQLVIAQTISKLGSSVFIVALTWKSLEFPDSIAVLGGVFACLKLSQLFLTLIGGAIADRIERRTIIVGCDTILGLAVASLAYGEVSGSLEVWHLFAIGATFGAGQAFSGPAQRAYLADSIPPAHLQRANGLFRGSTFASNLAGPLLGGVLIVSGGSAAAFAFDAATYFASAAILVIGRSTPGRAPAVRLPLIAQVAEGWQHVRGIPWIWIGLCSFAAFNALEALARHAIIPALLAEEIGGGPASIGLLQAAQTGGILLALGLVALVPIPRTSGWHVYGLLGAFGFAAIGLAFSHAIVQVLAFTLLHFVSIAIASLLWETALMSAVPAPLRGRVFALDIFSSNLLVPLSLLLAAPLQSAIGLRGTLVAIGTAVVILLSSVLTIRRGREFSPPSTAPPREVPRERFRHVAPFAILMILSASVLALIPSIAGIGGDEEVDSDAKSPTMAELGGQSHEKQVLSRNVHIANDTVTVEIVQANLNRVLIELDCRDALESGTYRVRIAVRNPEGIADFDGSYTCGPIEIPFDVDPGKNGIGSWTIAIDGQRGSLPDSSLTDPQGHLKITVAGTR